MKLWKALDPLALMRLGMGHETPGSIQTVPSKSEWLTTLNKVELKHRNTWPEARHQLLQLSSHCSGVESGETSHSRKETFVFLLLLPKKRERERETRLPFPEQFISRLDKTPCYIYPTKIADDTLPAAVLPGSVAYGPVNHTLLTTETETASAERQKRDGKTHKTEKPFGDQLIYSAAGWL